MTPPKNPGVVVVLVCFVVCLCCVAAAPNNCVHTSADGRFYDLSPLSRCDNTGYATEDDEGFVINFCTSVANSGCSGNPAVCQKKYYNVGDASKISISDYVGGTGVVLKYGGGDGGGCPNNAARSSIFNFICDPGAFPDPYIEFLAENPTCTYNFEVRSKYACPITPGPQINTCTINVFLVPHTHDDVGWLLTVDQYYDQQVRNIISTVVANLDANPDRRFIYVEMAYFWRWWTDTQKVSDAQRATFRKVYARGQLEFVIGGWVMQDEACTTYGADANQMELGHQFLLNNFGALPTKGWQLDPFGASSVTPTLNKLSGFDFHLIDRVSDKSYYIDSKNSQFVWQGSPSLGQKAAIFTEIMNGPINAYCDWFFAFNFEKDPVNSGNVASYGQQFIAKAKAAASHTKTNNVLAAWGCDFQFQDATPQFHSMDQVVNYLKSQQDTTNVYVKYATVSDYYAALKSSNVQWPEKSAGDFFPLFEDLYWTGYFTSRTVLKGQVRQGEAAAHAAEEIFALGRVLNNKVNQVTAFNQLFTLRLANANAQHHDGVTGTSEPPVVQMYQNDIVNGMASALQSSSTILGSLITTVNPPTLSATYDALLNLKNGQTIALVLYNSLGWTRNDIVSLPLNRNDVTVLGPTKTAVLSQVNPSTLSNAKGKFDLYFQAAIPPVGYTTYFVTAGSSSYTYQGATSVMMPGDADIVLTNKYVSVTISGTTGRISAINNLNSSVNIKVDQNLQAYKSYKSGAYAFTPSGRASPVSASVPKTVVTNGPIVNEAFQTFATQGNWAQQVVRVYSSPVANADVGNFVEIAHQIGSLPSQTEVITNFATSLNTNKLFFSDDNGFEFVDRISDYPVGPIQGNHYPSIYASGISDGSTQFTVISDRSHSCASLDNGQFEVFVHRNPDQGDGFGPALKDTDVAYPVIRLVTDTVAGSKLPARKLPLLLNFPVHVFTTPVNASNWSWPTGNQFITQPLPANVHLLSLNALNNNSTKAIFRLTHLFAVGEHVTYSTPVSVNVGSLFRGLTVKSFVETTLTGNKVLVSPAPLQVQLVPKDIRTFIIEF